jgi:hypothetical protein
MIVDAGEGDELDGRAGGHDMRAGRRHLPQQRKTKDNMEMILARWARPTCTETTARRRARRRPAAETDNVIVRHQREKVRCHGKKVEKKECLTRNTPMVSDRVWAPKIREGRVGGGDAVVVRCDDSRGAHASFVLRRRKATGAPLLAETVRAEVGLGQKRKEGKERERVGPGEKKARETEGEPKKRGRILFYFSFLFLFILKTV